MAVFNGPWGPRNAGQNRQRLTAQIDQSPSSVGSGTSSVSLRLRVWYESAFSVSWNGVGVSVSGGWSHSGSVNISHGGSGGRTLIYDSTITVPTAYASTVKRSFTATTSGVTLFSPSSASVSGTHTVQARPYSSPAAPSVGTPTRVSDSQVTVPWTRNSTTGAPYSSQVVQRSERNAAGAWSSWVSVANVSGSATSYADTSVVANREYRYRVQAKNAAGTGTSGASGVVRTTPAAPTIGSAVKLSDGDIRVTFTANQRYSGNVTHLVEGRPGAGAWSQVGSVAGSPFTHSSPDPAQPWSYRVRTRSTSPGTLTSGYSAVSNSVQLLAAPNAPTLRSPAGVQDQAAIVVFTWRHNPVDTTEQAGYQLRYRVNSGSWTTLSGTTAETRTLSALGVSGSVEWQVRTRGAHPDWSSWSAVASFTLAASPLVAINTPVSGMFPSSRVVLEVGYFHADGSPQTGVQAELIQGGQLLETLSWAKEDSGAFRTALDDAETYTVRARVQAGNGLWSDWDAVTFTTDFPTPLPRVVEGEWDRATGSVTLSSWADGIEGAFTWTGDPYASQSQWWEYDHLVATNLEPDPTGVTGDGWGGESYREPVYGAVFVPGGYGLSPFSVAPYSE